MVCDAAVIQRPESVLLSRIHADDHRSVAAERNVKVARKLIHHRVAADIHFRHQASFLRVKARVDNRTVGLRRPAADVLAFLDHADIQPVFRELPRDSRARDTSAYNDNIIHLHFLLFFR